MKLERRLSTSSTTANVVTTLEHDEKFANINGSPHQPSNNNFRMQQSQPPVVPSSLVAKHTVSSTPNLRAMSTAYNDHTDFSQPLGATSAAGIGTGATILSTPPMSYLMAQRQPHNNTNNVTSSVHTPFARPIVSQPQPPQPPPPSLPQQEVSQDHQTQQQHQSSFRPLPINYPRLCSGSTGMPQMPSNLRLEDNTFRRPWPAPALPLALPSNASNAMHHHHLQHRLGNAANRHAPLRHLPGVSGEAGGTLAGGGETGGNMSIVQQWLGDVDTGSGHHPSHSGLQGLTSGDTEPGTGNTIDGGMLIGDYGDDGALRRFASRSRLPRSRPRPNTLSEHEKRARHNAHTKSSRLRIDKGLERLKDALKKARPDVKLNKKADIVDAAVKYVLETLGGVSNLAPQQHHHHQRHHEQHDSSLSG